MVEKVTHPNAPESPRDTQIINALSDYVEPWLHTKNALPSTRVEAIQKRLHALEVLQAEFRNEYAAGGEFERMAAKLRRERVSQDGFEEIVVGYFKKKYRGAIETRITQQNPFGPLQPGQLYFDTLKYQLLYGLTARRDLPPSQNFITEEITSPADALASFGVDQRHINGTGRSHDPTQALVGGVVDYLIRYASQFDPSSDEQNYSVQHPEEIQAAFALYKVSEGDLDHPSAREAFKMFAKLYLGDNLGLGITEAELVYLLRVDPHIRWEIIQHYRETYRTHQIPPLSSTSINHDQPHP